MNNIWKFDILITFSHTRNNVIHLEQSGLQHLAGLARTFPQECRLTRLRRRTASLLTLAHHLTLKDKRFFLCVLLEHFSNSAELNNYMKDEDARHGCRVLWSHGRVGAKQNLGCWFIRFSRRRDCTIGARCTHRDIIATRSASLSNLAIWVKNVARKNFKLYVQFSVLRVRTGSTSSTIYTRFIWNNLHLSSIRYKY